MNIIIQLKLINDNFQREKHIWQEIENGTVYVSSECQWNRSNFFHQQLFSSVALIAQIKLHDSIIL